MANYNERLLDRKIEKKLKSTGGILLKGVRFCGKTTTAMYGPVETTGIYPARMWQGTFNKNAFSSGLSTGSFYLEVKRIRATLHTNSNYSGGYWKYDTNDEYPDGHETQKFDRYIKISIDTENGKKMINAADGYLRKHPEYNIVGNQCDNMTSNIAAAGGKGYPVKSTPNASFKNIESSWKLSIQYVEQGNPQKCFFIMENVVFLRHYKKVKKWQYQSEVYRY